MKKTQSDRIPVNTKRVIKGLFLSGLFLLILFSFDLDILVFEDLKGLYGQYLPLISVFTTVAGFFVIYFNRRCIAEVIAGDLRAKELEKIRAEAFPEKFPGLNRVPVIRPFIKFMYKEGWAYSITLFLVVIVSIPVLSYNVGQNDIFEDEHQVVAAAEGYLRSGSFYQWGYLENKLSDSRYDRAWPHTWLMAQSYKLFGVSEWSSRIVSVLFGICFILISYFITKFFTKSKLVSVIIPVSFLFNPDFIEIFRYARMYALLIPLFFILLYFFYRGITEENKLNNKFIKLNVNYNYSYAFSSLLLLCLSYLIHLNSLVIAPVIFLFVIYLWFLTGERKYIVAISVGIIGLIFTAIISTKGYIWLPVTFFGKYNSAYLNYLTRYPFSENVNVPLLALGILLLFLVRNKELSPKLVYFYIAFVFSLVFFIFVADRYPAYNYVSHIVPVSMILSIYMFVLFIRTINNRMIKTFFVLILLFGVANAYSNEFDKIYLSHGRTHISEAYKTIIDNYDPEKEIILGQYLRTYYLKPLKGNARIISMLNYRGYRFETFWKDIHTYRRGWVTWETRKSFHVDPHIIMYAGSHLKKYHGKGVDDNQVEVFYFDESMLNFGG